jgi:hypothetical protein
LIALLAIGCSRPVVPVLQSGDVVRPEISFAPNEPWPADAKVTIGMLVRVERPGCESCYVNDVDIEIGRSVMGGRVTFFNGEQVIGEPHEVPLVHDC